MTPRLATRRERPGRVYPSTPGDRGGPDNPGRPGNPGGAGNPGGPPAPAGAGDESDPTVATAAVIDPTVSRPAATAVAARPWMNGWFAARSASRPATAPPESRGLPRDGVRLLVSDDRGVEHARFRDLPRFLRGGDLLVVNTSATLPAAVDGERRGRAVAVHFSTALDDDGWVVEIRPTGRATGPVRDIEPGEEIGLPGDSALTVLESYPVVGVDGSRLWRATMSGAGVAALLRRHGRPIAYAYVEGRWPLESYQTVFARHPGSAEMPSAGRPFSDRLVTCLVADGIAIAPIVLHTGVSSLEPGEGPLPEPFRVAESTAARVNATRAAGGRVIAVGTTAARALESAMDGGGRVVARAGWTDLVLGPEQPVRVVDGLITGWHEPGSSHLRLLEAVAGAERVASAYREAAFAGYLWHEFGDSALLLRDGA